jgi:hypothetical protein
MKEHFTPTHLNFKEVLFKAFKSCLHSKNTNLDKVLAKISNMIVNEGAEAVDLVTKIVTTALAASSTLKPELANAIYNTIAEKMDSLQNQSNISIRGSSLIEDSIANGHPLVVAEVAQDQLAGATADSNN